MRRRPNVLRRWLLLRPSLVLRISRGEGAVGTLRQITEFQRRNSNKETVMDILPMTWLFRWPTSSSPSGETGAASVENPDEAPPTPTLQERLENGGSD